MLKVFDSIKRGRFLTGLLAVGLAMSACAVEDVDGDAPSTPANDPIAEVTAANGTKVSFFEPSPGTMAIGQQTALGVAPIDAGGMSPLEFYRSLAPGESVPQQLVDAQARADAARGDRVSTRSTPKSTSAVAAGAQPASFTSSWFEDNHCYETDRDEDGDVIFWHFINCHASPLPTQSLSGTHSDVDEFWVSACANTASITLRVWVEDEKKLGIELNPNHCYTYHWWSGTFNADFFKVTTTVTDSGNYGLAVKWNQ